MAAVPEADPLSDAEYDQRTRRVLTAIEVEVDRLLEDDVVDIDAGRSGGLLELRFPDGRVIVVNTQPPLHEIWLAWPAGGHHFRCVAGRWLDTKSGDDFFAVLSTAATALAGKSIAFAQPPG
jgi:CyaY protein